MAEKTAFLPLPDYECPPVIETVLGVQFEPLSGAKNAHLGAFWKTLDSSQWPTVTEAAPVPTQIERFGVQPQWGQGLRLQLTQDRSFRLQVRNLEGDRMIQVQNSRLHFNWMGKGKQGYPRYDRVRQGFVSVLDQFTRFAADECLGDFLPNQWEVTYINEIPRGTVWNSPADWAFFRPLAGVPTIENVVEGESFGGEWHFTIPGQRGRLHVGWQHAEDIREGEGAEAQDFIRLTFTARGSVGETAQSVLSILDGLDLGRKTIVRSFRALMSDEANQFWGLKDDS